MFHIYILPPIDHGFEMLRKCDMDEATNVGIMLREALEQARLEGWEGDFQIKPRHLVLLPNDGDCELHNAFIWKQSNNGSVFIASQYPVDFLASYLA